MISVVCLKAARMTSGLSAVGEARAGAAGGVPADARSDPSRLHQWHRAPVQDPAFQQQQWEGCLWV